MKKTILLTLTSVGLMAGASLIYAMPPEIQLTDSYRTTSCDHKGCSTPKMTISADNATTVNPLSYYTASAKLEQKNDPSRKYPLPFTNVFLHISSDGSQQFGPDKAIGTKKYDISIPLTSQLQNLEKHGFVQVWSYHDKNLSSMGPCNGVAGNCTPIKTKDGTTVAYYIAHGY